MAKKPFSVRVEPHVPEKFNVLSAVLNISNDKLLEKFLNDAIEQLNDEQRHAFDILLKVRSNQGEK